MCRIMIVWGKEKKLFDELFPLQKWKIYYDRTNELEIIKQKLFAFDMMQNKLKDKG